MKKGIIRKNHVPISIWLPEDADHGNVPQAKKTQYCFPFPVHVPWVTTLQESSWVSVQSTHS